MTIPTRIQFIARVYPDYFQEIEQLEQLVCDCIEKASGFPIEIITTNFCKPAIQAVAEKCNQQDLGWKAECNLDRSGREISTIKLN
jgi:hypothetical protein